MAITETAVRYADASTRRVSAENAIEYAYRDLGEGWVPTSGPIVDGRDAVGARKEEAIR
jgi:hypothetical protein